MPLGLHDGSGQHVPTLSWIFTCDARAAWHNVAVLIRPTHDPSFSTICLSAGGEFRRGRESCNRRTSRAGSRSVQSRPAANPRTVWSTISLDDGQVGWSASQSNGKSLSSWEEATGHRGHQRLQRSELPSTTDDAALNAAMEASGHHKAGTRHVPCQHDNHHHRKATNPTYFTAGTTHRQSASQYRRGRRSSSVYAWAIMPGQEQA